MVDCLVSIQLAGGSLLFKPALSLTLFYLNIIACYTIIKLPTFSC